MAPSTAQLNNFNIPLLNKFALYIIVYYLSISCNYSNNVSIKQYFFKNILDLIFRILHSICLNVAYKCQIKAVKIYKAFKFYYLVVWQILFLINNALLVNCTNFNQNYLKYFLFIPLNHTFETTRI